MHKTFKSTGGLAVLVIINGKLLKMMTLFD